MKKKWIKGFLAGVAAAVLAVTAMPATAFAEEVVIPDFKQVRDIGYDGAGEKLYENICEYTSDGENEAKRQYISYQNHAEGNKYEYEYDNTGAKTREIEYDADGVVIIDTSYTYDSHGNLIETVGVDASGNKISWNKKEYEQIGEKWVEKKSYIYRYDDDTDVLNYEGYSVFFHDENGYQIKSEDYDASGALIRYYVIDPLDGNQYKSNTKYNAAGEPEWKSVATYVKHGNSWYPTEDIEYSYNAGVESIESRVTYEYVDIDGGYYISKQTDYTGNEIVSITETSYDEHGWWIEEVHKNGDGSLRNKTQRKLNSQSFWIEWKEINSSGEVCYLSTREYEDEEYLIREESHDYSDGDSWYTVYTYDTLTAAGGETEKCQKEMVKRKLSDDSVIDRVEYEWKVYYKTIETGEDETGEDETVTMYRVYNPNSGEHIYTSDVNEKDVLVEIGWSDEGAAWEAPALSETPVYRLYNHNSGEHHYTKDWNEAFALFTIHSGNNTDEDIKNEGWDYEGIGWYSAGESDTPLYRLYNPNATGEEEAGSHHYTKDLAERDTLVSLGWRAEGIGWYGY